MQFRAIIKDAKLSKNGVIIRALASDDCDTNDLRAYFDEPVMLDVNLIAQNAEYMPDPFAIDGD